MLTYSEYYNLVKLGLSALEEKLKEASNFTSEQYHKALQREQEETTVAEADEIVEDKPEE